MSTYELMVIVPTIGDSGTTETAVEIVEAVVKKAGGKVKLVEEMGEKQLAYRIMKNDRGLYFLFEVKINSEKAKELHKQLRLQRNLLRYLLIKLDV